MLSALTDVFLDPTAFQALTIISLTESQKKAFDVHGEASNKSDVVLCILLVLNAS